MKEKSISPVRKSRSKSTSKSPVKRNKSRTPTRKKDKKRRSRSKSKDRSEKRKSKDHHSTRSSVKRDYDEEEKGFNADQEKPSESSNEPPVIQNDVSANPEETELEASSNDAPPTGAPTHDTNLQNTDMDLDSD